MKRIKYNMFGAIESPGIILSTKWHYHLGTIENIVNGINTAFNMNTCDEISFDVHKEVDGKVCSLWDEIVDLKYIYVPDYDEYFEITISMDDSSSTVKHISGKSAGETELSQKLLRDFHCNDETDILHPDYTITVFYNPDNTNGSLLHRVLHDKGGEWSIGHVDGSIRSIQRTFNCDGNSIYDFLVNTVAEEIGCLFEFDSVRRIINAYDIRNTCLECGHRGEFVDFCPKCKSTNFTYGYGTFQNTYISSENYMSSITVSGEADSVKNCFNIKGGDDLITATVANINPSGSNYIYRFSDAMYHDMPEELSEKLKSYADDMQRYSETYSDYTLAYYEAVDEILRLQTSMMPQSEIPEDTTAEEQLQIIMNTDFTVAINRNNISHTTADNSVKSYARVLIDPRYSVDIEETEYNESTNTWSGLFVVKSLGGVNADGEPDEAKSTTKKSVPITTDDYEKFLYQKIEKALDRTEYGLTTLFKLESDDDFKEALKLYSLDRLSSFESSYNGILEVLHKQGVGTDPTNDKNKTSDYDEMFGTHLYEDIYMPYYRRLGYIQDEMIVREEQIKVPTKQRDDALSSMKEIQNILNLEKYLGSDLFKIFLLYLREDTYTNSNYISNNLDNPDVINMAKELLLVAQENLYKASELQYTLSGSLNNFLSTKDFEQFKDNFEIGDWIVCRADGENYILRVISVEINYAELSSLNVTFSNVSKVSNFMDDTKSVLDQAKSMSTSFQYYANQAEQGNKAEETITQATEIGLDTKDIVVNAGNNNDVTIDEHGITVKYFDDELNRYSNEQVKITNGILAFTNDNWETVSIGLGKHTYTKYDKEKEKFLNDIGYGLSSDFVQAGYIYGSQMIAGDIYSSNYEKDKQGSHIDLNDGTFDFAGGNLTYDGEKLSVKGTIESKEGHIGGWTIKPEAIESSYTYIEDTYKDTYTTQLHTPNSKGSTVMQVFVEHIDGNVEYPFRIMADGKVYAQELYLNTARIMTEDDTFSYGSYVYMRNDYSVFPIVTQVPCTALKIIPMDDNNKDSVYINNVKSTSVDCKKIYAEDVYAKEIISPDIKCTRLMGNIHTRTLEIKNKTTDANGRIETDLYSNVENGLKFILGIQGSLGNVLYRTISASNGRQLIEVVNADSTPKTNTQIESITVYYLCGFTE